MKYFQMARTGQNVNGFLARERHLVLGADSITSREMTMGELGAVVERLQYAV